MDYLLQAELCNCQLGTSPYADDSDRGHIDWKPRHYITFDGQYFSINGEGQYTEDECIKKNIEMTGYHCEPMIRYAKNEGERYDY